MGGNGRDPFEQDVNGLFVDPRKEAFVKARAKGMSQSEVCGELGISSTTASKWDKNEAISAKIVELRSNADTFVSVSAGSILRKLNDTAQEARKAGQFKAAIDGYKTMYEIVTKNPNLANDMATAPLPDSTRPAAAQLLESLRKSTTEALALSEQEPVDTVGEPVEGSGQGTVEKP